MYRFWWWGWDGPDVFSIHPAIEEAGQYEAELPVSVVDDYNAAKQQMLKAAAQLRKAIGKPEPHSTGYGLSIMDEEVWADAIEGDRKKFPDLYPNP